MQRNASERVDLYLQFKSLESAGKSPALEKVERDTVRKSLTINASEHLIGQ